MGAANTEEEFLARVAERLSDKLTLTGELNRFNGTGNYDLSIYAWYMEGLKMVEIKTNIDTAEEISFTRKQLDDLKSHIVNEFCQVEAYCTDKPETAPDLDNVTWSLPVTVNQQDPQIRKEQAEPGMP